MAMYAHYNVVELDTETSVLVEGKVKVRDVGKPILPCISYDFYLEIKEEIEPATIESTDMTIMLAWGIGNCHNWQ